VDVHGATFLYKGKPHTLGVVRDITEQVHAYELLQQRVEERTRELSALLDISRNVASTLELQPVLSLVLDQLRTVVNYVDSSILLKEGDDLVHLDYRGPIPEGDILHIRVPILRDGPLGEALLQGKPVIIDDARGDSPEAREYWKVLGEEFRDQFAHIRSWLGVPLMVKDRFIGLLAVISDQPGYYTEAHAQLVLTAANQAAIAIENARLYKHAQELAAVEERQRLARELHDSVTQAIFSMGLYARAAQMTLEREGVDPSGRAAENVRQLVELAQGSLAEMRALIFELRPGALQEEGLVAALRKHAAAVSAREGLTVEVEAPEDRPALEPATEEHLYRAAQEALHNVIKHAGATRVLVRVEVAGEGLSLEVLDDGAGFDSRQVPPGHLGLRTMAERARQIGGTIDIMSNPGQGTMVRLTVPHASPSAAQEVRRG
jgi:signal transduction histidine kinase